MSVTRAGAWRMVPAPLLASRVLWFAVVVGTVRSSLPNSSLIDGIRQSLTYWDAQHYVDIATTGYPAHTDFLDAFLPGYPLLMRAVAVVTRDYVLAGWLVSLAADAIALFYIARLIGAERDHDDASLAVWLTALAPAALFFVAVYTESAFVAAAAASLYYARRGDARAAAIAAALACSVRITGLALIPALLVEQLSRAHWRPDRRLWWLLLVPLPILVFFAYLYMQTHDSLAFFHAQVSSSFLHRPAWPWDGFQVSWNTLTHATDGETRSIWAREIAFGLLGLVLSAAMWIAPRIPRSFAIYCTLAWLLTASLSFWVSEARYDLALFPAVLLVCDLTRRVRVARPVVVLASGALMCAGVWIYAQGRWLG